jgi:hypothetical protein
VNQLRAELRSIVDKLVAVSSSTREVSLDALGNAIGTLAVSYTEIDAMISALEARGRHVTAPSSGRGEAHLASVLTAARALSSELGRRPSTAEIALRAGLSADQVKHALVLARVMQR